MISANEIMHKEGDKVSISTSAGVINIPTSEARQIGVLLNDSSNDYIVKSLVFGLRAAAKSKKDEAMMEVLREFLTEDELQHQLKRDLPQSRRSELPQEDE